MRIRPAEPDDLGAIVEILNQAIRARTNGFLDEVTTRGREAWLASHADGHPLLVAEIDGAVVGFAELSPYRPGRGAFRHAAEIAYYVHEAHRRRGVSTTLLEHLVAACPALGVHTLVAALLASNAPSIAFLEKHGFERWAHLPGVASLDGREVGHLLYGRRLALVS